MWPLAFLAAGLVRLMERWPHVDAETLIYPQLDQMLERVPPGGRALVGIDERGIYTFEYEYGTLP